MPSSSGFFVGTGLGSQGVRVLGVFETAGVEIRRLGMVPNMEAGGAGEEDFPHIHKVCVCNRTG